MAKSKFPTVWTTIMKRRVETLFDQGASIAEVCREMGISRNTFKTWRTSVDAQKAAFREAIVMGLEASEAWWLRQGRENLENRGFNNHLWQLNMMNRWLWNTNKKEERKEISHIGTVEVKNKVDVESIVEKAVSQGVKQMAKSIH